MFYLESERPADMTDRERKHIEDMEQYKLKETGLFGKKMDGDFPEYYFSEEGQQFAKALYAQRDQAIRRLPRPDSSRENGDLYHFEIRR